MDAHLHAQLDEVIEEVRDALHQQAEYWSTIRAPSELFDFEQGLQAVLNTQNRHLMGIRHNIRLPYAPLSASL